MNQLKYRDITRKRLWKGKELKKGEMKEIKSLEAASGKVEPKDKNHLQVLGLI